jgi:pyruvate-ferredoxin/flavodoxin oxidoreductase
VRPTSSNGLPGHGDDLPVSLLPVHGTYPSGTTRFEKRNLAIEIPEWDPAVCIQCNNCVLVCPHAVIRAKVYGASELDSAPAAFASSPARWKEFPEALYTLQVAPEDCTGCGLCVEACPAKNKSDTSRKAINMVPQAPRREAQARNWDFFLGLSEVERDRLNLSSVKDSQLLQPLFEFSGACAGCGETPYLKLLSQLFGDRALVANATGCSSIYGGNLPTTPWTFNEQGRGPAWSNSLFEDNAEFGLGFRLSLDEQTDYARELVSRLAPDLADGLLHADQSTPTGLFEQRRRVAALKGRLAPGASSAALDLLSLADVLVKRSVWIVGGDGWAYDIGYGGLDHVLASGRNVNVLVLDTEVYSNTGGQMSKSTSRGAVAKFAAGGKQLAKKDLGLLAVSYGNIYVARVAVAGGSMGSMGTNDAQTVRAFVEAESYDGPSLIIAYSPCIAHGYDPRFGLDQQKKAVLSGHWPLFRFDPRHGVNGGDPFQLDARPPSIPLEDYMYAETRYSMLTQSDPAEARRLLGLAQQDVHTRWEHYSQLAAARNGADRA